MNFFCPKVHFFSDEKWQGARHQQLRIRERHHWHRTRARHHHHCGRKSGEGGDQVKEPRTTKPSRGGGSGEGAPLTGGGREGWREREESDHRSPPEQPEIQPRHPTRNRTTLRCKKNITYSIDDVLSEESQRSHDIELRCGQFTRHIRVGTCDCSGHGNTHFT